MRAGPARAELRVANAGLSVPRPTNIPWLNKSLVRLVGLMSFNLRKTLVRHKLMSIEC